MALIGSFYIMTTFLGFGAATIVGRDFIATHGGTNMSGPLLAQALAGDIFFAFICAIAFATILAVVAGLTVSAVASALGGLPGGRCLRMADYVRGLAATRAMTAAAAC
jgi:cation/acetate symporter